MPRIKKQGRVLDARPDRVDLRDRVYQPALVSLPDRYPSSAALAEHFAAYRDAGLVGNQGDEGSCTGWALRGVVNYLLFRRALEHGAAPGEAVSARMLYHLARIYDEWDGEDYEGSSCRGAMKGWHKHGVCHEDLWPYVAGEFVRPEPGWDADAASRPLGAYYRIEKDSIADLQAAIHEVGAVYVSADVHSGWFAVANDGTAAEPPLIRYPRKRAGGHAFTLVGYTPDGFVVQNSWGTDWGYHGFAVVTYEDWVANGMDAWVAVLGAPMKVSRRNDTVSGVSLQSATHERAELFGLLGKGADEIQYEHAEVRPLVRTEALRHAVVLGNEGRPLRRLLEFGTAADALGHVAFDRPRDWLVGHGNDGPKVAIYAHGGLNAESSGIKRTQVLAPYFLANGIYPLFAVWKTGLWETLTSILEDVADRVLPWRSTGWLDDAAEWLGERKDRSVEFAARGAVKPVWTEMKENAAMAAQGGGASVLLAHHLAALRQALPKLEVHLIGHSAGSILLGHLLDLLGALAVPVKSLHLYAPACTTEFALRHYLPQLAAGGALSAAAVRIHDMNDERERADSVGPYGKSLLYLVSRALEPRHKTPLLGLAEAWDRGSRNRDRFHDDGNADVAAWVKAWGDRKGLHLHDEKRVSTGHAEIPLAHGSFDNDVKVIGRTIRQIRGRKLAFPIENLAGF